MFIVAISFLSIEFSLSDASPFNLQRSRWGNERFVKPKNMTMLILLGLTGDLPRKGEACYIASEILLEEVNRRTDILRDYHIKPDYRDEGAGSFQSLHRMVEHKRQISELQSPIMIGPWYSGGCKAASPAAAPLDLVQSALGCNVPGMTANRKLYPNMYRARGPVEMVVYPELRFTRDIGGWNRFGLISDSTNLGIFAATIMLHNEALANGFEIPFFELLPDVEDYHIQQLLAADVRIVNMFTGLVPLIIKFLCKSRQWGMTGPKYVFIFMTYFEPSSLAPEVLPGCTRQMIWEQLKYTIFLTYASVNTEDPETKNVLGYNLPEFDERFAIKWQLMGGDLKVLPADYEKRTICHDPLLAAIVALESTEQRLKLMNMTLSDYETDPTLVMKIANQSMAEVDYQSLRIGRFRYSQRLEPDDDQYLAVQWTEATGLMIQSSFKRAPETPALNYSSYSVRKDFKPVMWFTKNGKPPQDRHAIVLILDVSPKAFFWTIVSISVLITIKQAFLFIVSIQRESFVFYGDKLGLVFGCAFLNASAIVLGFRMEKNTSSAIFALQRVFPVLAFSFLQSSLFSRLLFHRIYATFPESCRRNDSKLKITGNSSTRKSQLTAPNSLTRPDSASNHAALGIRLSNASGNLPVQRTAEQISQLQDNKIRVQRYFARSNALALICSIGYLLVWLTIDAPNGFVKRLSTKYDSERDTISIVETVENFSKWELAWLAPLLIVHAALFGLASFFSYVLRKSDHAALYDDLVYYRMTVTNITPLYFGAILLFVVLENSPTGQFMSASIFAVLISLAASCGIFWSQMKGLRTGFSRNNGIHRAAIESRRSSSFLSA